MSTPGGHRVIVCVDIEGFGRRNRTNQDQLELRKGLYQLLERAFTRSSTGWDERYREDRGDGVFVLVTPDVSKSDLITRLPSELVAAVAGYNRRQQAETQIRLRVAIHAGEIHFDDHGVSGAALNLAFRLLDAGPVKSALRRSPGVLALVVSDWFYEDVVRHTTEAAPASFWQIQVDVKETKTTGWLCLPDQATPSGTGRPPPAALGTATPITTIHTTSGAESAPRIAISPDGESLAVCDFSNTVRVYDTTTWRPLLTLTLPACGTDVGRCHHPDRRLRPARPVPRRRRPRGTGNCDPETFARWSNDGTLEAPG